MRNRAFRLAGWVLACALAAGCQGGGALWLGGEDGTSSSATGRSGVYDFGTVFFGQSGTRKILVKNAGTGPLRISALEKRDGAPVKIADGGEPGAVFQVDFAPAELAPGGTLELSVTFTPPNSDTAADYLTHLVLRAENTAAGADTATLSLHGVGAPDFCQLPAVLDFGNVAVDGRATAALTLTNSSLSAITAQVGGITSGNLDASAFALDPSSPPGELRIEPGAHAEVTVSFHPGERKSYRASLGIRPAPVCPAQEITLQGNAVDALLTWSPATIDCGYVTPGVEVHRTITFQNVGQAEVEVTGIVIGLPAEFFVVPEGTTSLTVPARGTAELTVACRPVVLGPRSAQLAFATSLPQQPSGRIPLRTFGGGADIEVTPAPDLDFGKVAYFPGSNPPSFAGRKVRVRNVGSAPGVSDPRANLHFGVDDGSGTYALRTSRSSR